ncbi:MAG: phosphate ABC transporter permease PtsA [Candidatus Dadabacteria bacterium]
MEGKADIRKRAIIRRRIISRVFLTISTLTAIYGIFWLFWILSDLFINGFRYIHIGLLMEDMNPAGVKGGGLRHAFVGHLIITSIATVMGVTVGVFAGIFFAEYGRDSRFIQALRNVTDIMVSTPSIVMGALVYAVLVKPVGHFISLGGSIALALIMMPVIAITTDEMLKLVPGMMREAAYALGAYKWQIIIKVTLRAAKVGILTGVILGIARITGETAPLLFTSFNNNFLETNILKPMASLTVTVFQFVMGPYDYWHEQAWAASLILTMGVLILSIIAKIIINGVSFTVPFALISRSLFFIRKFRKEE